ncbi:hypothetical protein [Cryptosporangium aurantiacum]|uniref:Uncharacterized protein n=1 Tax=Cryptosporangium aurantiacum TaxID=134849 RepID=A0A1M7PA68_9ACTN|nr:hypothetical protein [Cryptosporangium aurantiacum]SHN13628.1 hypothetical protein SAMN05443668_103109 [Cryptosporangium aurantiacum]
MTDVRVRIDRIAVEIGREAAVGEAEQTLRRALALLAARLATAPMAADREAPLRALELVEVEPVAPDWFAGPGAAARLADELYRRITGEAP